MNRDEIREVIFQVLGDIAPEMQPEQIEPGGNLRDQLDLDSMDFLNFVLGLHKELGVEIPENDYAQLSTLDGAVEYLAAHAGSSAGGG